jgi:hypothetical protein
VSIQSIYQTGLNGVNQGLAGMEQAAQDIVQSGLNLYEDPQGTKNLAEAAVELKVNEHLARASAQVVRTADETLGTLIDIFV